MERKYLEDLISWNNDPERKPLIVYGARQVGKTYLIEELFAKKFYKGKYLKIDCSDDIEFVNYVINNPKLSNVLDYINLKYNFTLDKDHLLIFDEAQECLPIIKMLKHFCELKREIPVILTGSLVRIKILREAHKRGEKELGKGFLFPVGKINQLYVYPLTFDEFLYNYDKNKYDFIKEHFETNTPIDYLLHKELLNIFNDYLFVGGMPEVVQTFINYKEDKILSFQKVVSKIKEIYDDYLADMDLYQASPESIIRSRLIYKDIYRQLNKENKNFKFSSIDEKVKGRDLLYPIGWLVTAKVINVSSILKERITLPLIKGSESLMRLYLSDVGMFTYQSGINYKNYLLDKDNTFSGIYYETFAANELIARGKELFYWKGKRNSEFEFILDYNSRIIPVDIKRGKSKLNSLDEFRMHNKKDIALKISSNQLGFDKDNQILTIPLYYFSFLLNEIQKDSLHIINDLIKNN